MSTKPPSWNQIRTNARKFASEWKDATSEQSDAQTFATEFLAIFGVERKRVAIFEQHAKRTTTGRRGRIDLFWPGTLVWEHKSAGKNLEEAERQALDYLDDLDSESVPNVVVTCDFQTIRMLDLGAPKPAPVTIELRDLPKHIRQFGFIAGYAKREFESSVVEVEANIKAAGLLGKLYEHLAADNYSDHQASILLTRLLFLLFGDDTSMWDRSLFAEMIDTRTQKDGSDLGAQLASLFTVLDTKEDKRSHLTDDLLKRFPYVNGGLFEERIDVPFFGERGREDLIAACNFEWGQISPAIFGSLFQSVKSKEARRELGEHYTSEANILKLIQPLFLDELHDRFDKAMHSEQSLKKLRADLGGMTFVDPACGCGNFLVVTYRELRRLDLRIFTRLTELQGQSTIAIGSEAGIDVANLIGVSLNQFHGIELEEWPARIAETALFLVDQQMNIELAHEYGEAPDRLPIDSDSSATIHNEDALKANWRDLLGVPDENVMIFGNPPFVGISLRTAEQTQSLQDVFGKGYHGTLDFVTAWYIKAVEYFGTRSGRWGFVSTNSICQGEPVPPLWGPIVLAGWRIRFAHRSFLWHSEAPNQAAVHVSIIGFDRKSTPKPILWTYPEGGKGDATKLEVTKINPYLIDAPAVVVLPRTYALSPSVAEVFYGNKPTDGKNFQVSEAQYAEFAADPYAAKYLRRYIGAKELIHDLPRWCLWLKDVNPTDVAKSHLLQGRLEAVKNFRLDSTAESTRKAASTPNLFRQIAQPTTNYLGIPRHVSEHRRYYVAAYYSSDVITSDANFLTPDPSGYSLGLISSSMFIAWQRAVGGRIKSDLRFNKFLTWNTFPIPPIAKNARAAIEEGSRGIITAREAHPGASLADLYNPLAMPGNLVKAHQVLDRAVDKAFGSTAKLETTEDRQRVLFRAYAKLTGQETLI